MTRSRNGAARDAAPTEALGLARVPGWSARIAWEPLKELRGLKGVAVYRDMGLNDPTVAAMLRAVEMTARRAAWTVAGADENDARALFVEECMSDMGESWNDHLSQALTFVQYGWAWFEIVYKYRRGPGADPASRFRDGRLGWRRFALRAQDTAHAVSPWAVDEGGQLVGFRQWLDGAEAVVPLRRSILYRTRAGEDPEGISALRGAYPAYYYAKNLREVEAIGLERDTSGMPVLTQNPDYGAGMDLSEGSDARAAAEALLRRVRYDEEAGVIVPKEWDFSFASAGREGAHAALDTTIRRYEMRMGLVLLAGWLFLGLDNTGAYALSKTLADIFYDSVEAWLDVIADTLNRHTVPKLLALNGLPLDDPPALQHEPVGRPDLGALGEYAVRINQVGALSPTIATEQWFRALAGMPALTDEEIAELQDQEAARQQQAAALQAALGQAQARGDQDDDADDEDQDPRMSLPPLTTEHYAVTAEDLERLTERRRRQATASLRRYYTAQGERIARTLKRAGVRGG